MWFKKKSVLQADGHYDTEKAVDGTDWRKTTKQDWWSVSQTLPSATDAGNYFYLPALGYYGFGKLDWSTGSFGQYWSSSAGAGEYKNEAYCLDFNINKVHVFFVLRYWGMRVDGFK